MPDQEQTACFIMKQLKFIRCVKEVDTKIRKLETMDSLRLESEMDDHSSQGTFGTVWWVIRIVSKVTKHERVPNLPMLLDFQFQHTDGQSLRTGQGPPGEESRADNSDKPVDKIDGEDVGDRLLKELR